MRAGQERPCALVRIGTPDFYSRSSNSRGAAGSEGRRLDHESCETLHDKGCHDGWQEVDSTRGNVALTQDSAFTYVQGLFQRGVVIIVGSGASCAYGLPSMGELAEHLNDEVPARISVDDEFATKEWERISTSLAAGAGLESALGERPLPESLADVLTLVITDRVRNSEGAAIAEILQAENISAFGRLFDHILRSATHADVITTNYDRLIEVHAARAGVRVDSMYYGHTVGRMDAALSREELYEAHAPAGRPTRSVTVRTRPHIRLAKPHGSLDWFAHEGQYYRSDLAIPGSRQIIAPGGNKYRLGYEVPFDQQRNRANLAIDGAASLLTVGYGFNDEHLQTHLRSRFAQVPAVVLSQSLTSSARSYLSSNPSAMGIEAAENGAGCRILQGDDDLELDLPLWDLEHLVKEVLSI